MATVAVVADCDKAGSGQSVHSSSVIKERGGEVIAHLTRALGPGSDGWVGGWVCRRVAQSEEGSDSGVGASWQVSGSAVAGEGGGEGGEGGEAGCSRPSLLSSSSLLSEILLLSPAPSAVLSPRRW